MGQQLSQLLQDAIQERIDNDDTGEETRDDVIGLMVEGMTIERDTVNAIVAGEIDCPPVERVDGLAEDLPVTQEDVRDAMEEDGCGEMSNTVKSAGEYDPTRKRAYVIENQRD